jgi:hypothetical protein
MDRYFSTALGHIQYLLIIPSFKQLVDVIIRERVKLCFLTLRLDLQSSYMKDFSIG